ncbi:MAG: dephospho-CoA kinase [Verrucomicrobiota bacterium]|jgi:dephospho-CoA kinase
MKLFGLTGGIAMGKSTAGSLLRQQGLPVMDTDTVARQLVEPGQPALAEILERFGPLVFLPDGCLDREQLARQVFSRPASRSALEAILHPRIRAAWTREVECWRAAGRASGAVVIPLLFETRAAPLFDATICVACSAATQARRLAERGWDAAQIKQRLDAQWSAERKIALSDYVVWTDTTLEVHAAQLRRILAGLGCASLTGTAGAPG